MAGMAEPPLDERIQTAYRATAEALARGHAPAQVKLRLLRDGVPPNAADLMIAMISAKLVKVRRLGARYRALGAVLVVGGLALIAAAQLGLWAWAIASIGGIVLVQGWLLA